jgi:hypothetical protein
MKTVFILDLRSDNKGIEIPATNRVSIRTMTHDTNIATEGGRGVLRPES